MSDVNEPPPQTAAPTPNPTAGPSVGQRLDSIITRVSNEWQKANKQTRIVAASAVGIIALLLFIILLLAMPGSTKGKPTKANYMKIELGMDENKVKEILGQPTTAELDGAGVHWTWYPQNGVDGKIAILVNYGKVLYKSMDGVEK